MIIWTLQVTASGQKVFDTFLVVSRLITIFMMVLFLLSYTPFWCGVYVVVSCLLILLLLHTFINSLFVYSPPWFVWRNLICCFVSFLTLSLNFLNISIASEFSTKVMSESYELPFIVVGSWIHWATYVWMHHLKDLTRSPVDLLRKLVSMLLFNHTFFRYMRWSFNLWKPSHNLFFLQRFECVEV